MLIGVNGLIGSGKGFCSEYLQNAHGFIHLSFAEALKRSISVIFGWEYDLLKGDTVESREWREQVDVWWANRLNMPNLTPRMVLQQAGTETWRNHFHEDIWIAALERKLNDSDNFVIDDCRFSNEFALVRKYHGELWNIQRGAEPAWHDTALNSPELMPTLYPNVHITEWGWCKEKFNEVIQNNGSVNDFRYKIDQLIKGRL